jgi:hypothetical protein
MNTLGIGVQPRDRVVPDQPLHRGGDRAPNDVLDRRVRRKLVDENFGPP